MNETLEVFGFGSFFRGAENARDIDLLLLHQSTQPASCRFAIECKRHLQRHLPSVDVVMLSDAEAAQNQFITRSGAIALGAINSENCEMQVRDLALRITSEA